MTRDQVLSRFGHLRICQYAGERTPHKPLLILVALAEWTRGRHSIRFADVLDELTNLLKDYGPRRKKYRPQDPFWRLQNDGVWEVNPASVQLGADGSPSIAELVRVDATGQFTADLRSAFLADPKLITALAEFMLQTYFPEPLHQDILNVVGLELREITPRRRSAGSKPSTDRLDRT